MRIAVTTDDREHVDAPFGLARHICIYEVAREGARFLETHRFPERAPGCDGDALARRVAALKNCTLLYTLEIGSRGSARALANGVRTVRVVRPRPISEVLSALRADLEAVPPWLRSLLRARKRPGGGSWEGR